VTIPCHSQELLSFLHVVYAYLPPFSTNYCYILPHFILLSISLSTSWSCFQINTKYPFGNSIFFPFPVHDQTNVIYVALLSLLWWGFIAKYYISIQNIGKRTIHKETRKRVAQPPCTICKGIWIIFDLEH
jgi:hypothetical protein